ncbi:MAG: hypothetical protein AB8B81_16520 [Halioglobus sp.]
MSQFEFVSVAVALLYSIAVGRLLGSLSDIFDSNRRYWVHAGWAVYLLLFSALSWWNFFAAAHDFEFGPITFLLTLCTPALVIVRAQLLTGRPSQEIASYRQHFYDNRVPFFAVGLASMTTIMLFPWLAGTQPLGEVTAYQLQAAPFMLIWIIGLVSARPAVHIALISVMLPLAAGLFLADAFIVMGQ